MPTKFDDWDIKRANQTVQGRADPNAVIHLTYYNGDHWRDGDGWVGPMPQPNEPNAQITAQQIQRAFVSRNTIAEVVNRHVNGVLGRELHWMMTPARPMPPVEIVDEDTGETRTEEARPTSQEQALIDEAEAALTQWWDRREVPEILQQMAASMLLTKRGVLRLYVPPGLRDEQGNVPTGDLAASMDRIWIQHVGSNEDTLQLQVPGATVYVDKKSRREIGVYVYRELVTDDPNGEQVERAELTYLDDSDQTVLRILDNGGIVEQAEPPLPLGGRLLHYEANRPSLITPQIVSQQNLLNLTETMKGRNVVLGGFLERILLNAQQPVEIVRDPVTGREKRVVKPFQAGAGTTNLLVGVEYVDEDGTRHMANPSVVYRDPVSTETFDSTAAAAYLSILQETQQLHYALAGDAVVSGESRVQARDAFQKDLQLTATKIEAAGRWILETALAMGALFANRAGAFEPLRAVVQARVDSGPVSPDGIRVAAEMAAAEIWDLEYTRSMTGVEDVDAMKERVAAERAESAARRATLATALLEQAETEFDREGNGFRPAAGARIRDEQETEPA